MIGKLVINRNQQTEEFFQHMIKQHMIWQCCYSVNILKQKICTDCIFNLAILGPDRPVEDWGSENLAF